MSSNASNAMHLYPVPANDQLNVEAFLISTITSVRLVDMTQREQNIPTEINANKATLNISDLDPGMYFVIISDGEHSFTQKIVKQ